MLEVHFASEPVQYQGNVMADMMTASIATSSYSQAETFLRETLQNACDQKPDGVKQIKFLVDGFQISGKKKTLFDDFFASARLGTDPLKLTKLKEAKTFEALVVADIGTIGLIGPLDASIDETPSNFAGFFFNVGRPSEESHKAGSFGLGRTVLTNASDYSTILVYSQFHQKGSLRKRFMGMSLAGAYSAHGRKFTGRHWFGQAPRKDEGLIRPFEGKDAEKFAIDFDLKGYLGDETGFVAIVIGNALVDDSQSSSAARLQRNQSIKDIQQAACLYGWPHMLGTKKQRSVEFHFICDKNELPEIDPSKMAVIEEFVLCYQALVAHQDGVNSTEIAFAGGGERKQTGKLTWLSVPARSGDLALANNGTIPVASVALMREANFVVKYLEVASSGDQIATRGVFKTNTEFDSIFRKSEPVAHDDWIPSKLQLKLNARNPIKQTLDNIKGNFRELIRKQAPSNAGSASVVLGNAVGRLLDGLALTGPPKPKPGSEGGDGASAKGIKVVPIGSPKTAKSSSVKYEAIFRFQITCPRGHEDNVVIRFTPYAILENGTPELDPPVGADLPNIVQISVDGKKQRDISKVILNSSLDKKIIEVTVSSLQGIGSTCRVKVFEK